MRYSALLLPLWALAALSACTMGGNVRDEEATDSVDVAMEDSLAMLRDERSEDHYAIWQMDSTNEVNFMTTDLAAMQVRGHVRTLTWGDYRVEYDEKGNLTRYNDGQGDFDIDYDPDGGLLLYAVGAGSARYSIDPETGLLACLSGGEGAYSFTNWYHYDRQGRWTEVEYNEQDGEDDPTERRERVTILEQDDHGNWTRCRIGKETHTRTITYYPNALGDE